METTSILPSALSAPPTQYSDTSGPDDAVISSDFETFLRMLTTQLENQDPLNPVESSDYAVQLATFSNVEQQVRTNDLLEGLGAKLSLMGLSDIAGWVGMEARAAAPVMFDQTPLTIVPKPAVGADETRLVVRDSNGTIVENEVIPVSAEPLQWDGIDGSGTSYPSGVYTFELISSGNGLQLTTEPVEVYGKITESQNEGGQLWLILESGERISAEDVTAIRDS